MGAGGSGVKPMPTKHSKIMTEKCIECHYYTGKAEVDNTPSEKGGHTFSLDDRVCAKCHQHDPRDMVAQWKPVIDELAKQLKKLLDEYPKKKSRIYLDAKRNYGMVAGDKGLNIYGVHNPQYAEALLKNGISILMSESTWEKKE